MRVARTWIFPIIRILIFLAIAAALVKIAFFADPTSATNPDFPTGEIIEPQVPVTIGTIQNDVELTGTVNADAAVPVKATLAGEVRKVLVTQGQAVAADTPVLTIRAEIPNADGTVAIKTATVTAGAAGILSSFAMLPGQVVAVGEAVGQVAPPSFNVTGALSPEQQYRLLSQPADAQVTITGGPAPFTCTGLTITTPLPGAGSGGGTGEGAATGTTVKCTVPAEVKVFPGLAANITISGGIAENVLTVPMTAVEGAAQTGNVYFVLPDGSTELRPVTLGLNDGINVQVIDGVAEGDLILQFIPGAPSAEIIPQPGECIDDGQGNVVCG